MYVPSSLRPAIQTLTVKPWGEELLWAKTPHYASKLIEIREGQRLSLQLHHKKHESIFVVQGILRLRIGDEEISLLPSEAYDIKPGTIHRFSAPYGFVRLLEVSTLELDDVERLEDDYGRL